MCEICRNAFGATRRSALTLAASALAAGLIGQPAIAAKKKAEINELARDDAAQLNHLAGTALRL